MSAKKRKTTRVPFQKNRGNRSRQKKVTAHLDDAALDQFETTQRVSGKGALTRHRTIADVDEENSEFVKGIVIQAIGANSCIVQTEQGERYECMVRKVLRSMARDSRTAVVAGDHIYFTPTAGKEGVEKQGVIEKILPRKGVLSRTSQEKEHIIASNIDHVIIVASAAQPALKPNLIDRFLVTVEKNQLQATICINKIDLAEPIELQPILGQYAQLGYPVLCTSASDGTGIEALRSLLRGQNTVFTGQSGVGKSSLLNAIQPGLGLRTQVVSNDSGKGRHTTRTACLLELDLEGWLIDTPGIRQMDLWNVDAEEVEGYFLEFRPFVRHCKFPDCSHTHEKECGIRNAVAYGKISNSRYESYLRIVEGGSH